MRLGIQSHQAMNGRQLGRADVTAGHSDVTAGPGDVTSRPFRVRPEAWRIWQQHTGGTVGALLGQPPPPPPPPPPVASLPSVPTGGADCVNAREKLRTNRSQGRHSGGGRQPMRALPINGVTEEALSHSKSSSSAASFAASPRSPRRHIDLSQLSGDLAAVEGVHGVRVISPGRQHAPAQNGGIPSLNGGFPSRDEGIPSPDGFRRVPSSGDIGSGSLSPGVTWSSSVNELDRGPPRGSDRDRSLHPGTAINSKGRPARPTNGDRLPSPRADREGIPSPAAEPPWTGGSGGGGDLTRAVRITVPDGDASDRSSDCDLRRERIRALIGSLRRPPADGSARAVTQVARELREVGRARPAPGTGTGTGRLGEPPATRFSDETRLSFREQALERARAPYRAPSLAGSRKFKSSETLRDGAAGARPPPEPSSRLLSRRKSHSVTRLSRRGDESAAARTGDRRGAGATRGAVTVNGAAPRATNGVTNGETSHHHPPSGHSGVSRAAPDNDSDEIISPHPSSPQQLASPQLASPQFESHQLESQQLESPHLASPQPASPQLASPQLASPHLSPHDASEPVKDFVRLNRRLASQRCRRSRSQPRSEEGQQAAAGGKTLPGSLPRYLVRRQQQWREEEQRRLAAVPDPACPAGHSRMPDTERRQTLDVLRDNHGTLLTELRALPIAHTSTRLEAQRADLERQLLKLEEGIRIFSRPKVFIKNDA